MDNIVMALLAGLPMADATSAASAAAGADDGGFAALVDAELALLAGAGKGGQESKAGDAGDSLAALLLASLIRGFVRKDAPDDETNEEAGAEALQAQTDTTAVRAQDALRQLMDILGRGNAGDAPAALQSLPESGREALEALAALLGGEGQTPDVFGNTASVHGNQPFAALIEALRGGADGATGADGASAADQTTLKALKEIRSIFAELLAGSADTAEEATQINDEALPQRPVRALALEMLGRIDALLDGAGEASGAADRPVVTLAVDIPDETAQTGAELASPDEGSETGAAVASGRKKESVDFASALRAYRGEIVHTEAKAPGATAENSAAAALRQGEQAFDAIVDKITSLQNAGRKEMEIRLKPDFLGRVVIKLTMGEDGLTASIAASNPKVQDAFLSQAPALQSSLMEHGLKDVRVVVTSSSVQDAALQQQQLSQGRGQARQDRPKRNLAAIQSAGSTPDVTQPLLAYEQPYRAGLVNRLA